MRRAQPLTAHPAAGSLGLAAILAAIGAVALAAPAGADVLVQTPAPRLGCGERTRVRVAAAG